MNQPGIMHSGSAKHFVFKYNAKVQYIIEHLTQGGLYVQFMVSKFKYLNVVSHFLFQD
jgi:hypothetical protein